MNFMIVVDDAGELKPVSEAELLVEDSALAEALNDALNRILDQRALDAGEYDPGDNSTPIVVSAGPAE